MTRKLAGLALLLLPLGCSEVAAPTEELRAAPSEGQLDEITLVIEAEEYVHLDTLEVRLVNGGGEAVGYNLCSSWRERETSTGWERIDPFRVCTADLPSLEPGGSASWREPVDPYWGKARYRIGTKVWPAGSSAPLTLVTEPFDVGP
jgi:hypothetical protein